MKQYFCVGTYTEIRGIGQLQALKNFHFPILKRTEIDSSALSLKNLAGSK